MVRILGIDPGSHKTGWGIIDAEGTRFRYVASGTITAKGKELAKRLVLIADALELIIGQHQPKVGAIETVFHAKNSQSALKLGHARGVALLSMSRAGLEIGEYSPTQIKQALTGAGRAQKEQVAQMVQLLLGHRGPFGLDESDGLAIAMCHGRFSGSPARKFLAAKMLEKAP